MDMPTAINRVVESADLTEAEMLEVMGMIMSGQATDAQIGGFLIGLRMKGETVQEILAAAKVMRDLATPVDVSPEYLVDTCGTGGSGSNKFNVSTASAFVAAAAGARVAKHGNRGASSKSGSADVLEAAGANIMLTPEQVARCIDEVGVGFLFAVAHHGAMKYAIGPRREMVTRTLFNLLGPLTNPAGAQRQLLGVFAEKWQQPIAEVLQELGSEHVLVVHSDDGLDEISIAAPTRIVELKDGRIERYVVSPADFGLKTADLDKLRVENPEESLALVRAALNGERDDAADFVALNAGAAIYVSGQTHSLEAGSAMAQDAIGGGIAMEKLKDFATFTQQITDSEA